MDKVVTKSELVKEIRHHLNLLGVGNGERLELNKLVSTQKVIIGEEVWNLETIVKGISPRRIVIEWYKNGELRDWSGEYPYNHRNVDYGIVMQVALTLRNKAEAHTIISH